MLLIISLEHISLDHAVGGIPDMWSSLYLQGLMFGYATDETEECMPLTILLAHKLNYRMKELSRSGECPWILPDSKSQVSLAFHHDNNLRAMSYACRHV